MTSLVKICGLRTPEDVAAALAAGADMVGLVRFPGSPRHVDLEVGRELSRAARGRALRVLLVVDPTDPDLDADVAALDPDLIQLHGREDPARVAAIGRRTGRPLIKAVGIAGPGDLAAAAAYGDGVAHLLLDAKPAPGASRPGGNGAAFDWSLLGEGRGRGDRDGLILSGGLTPGNVAEAIAATGLRAVDVSSGVETRPGRKDPALIAAFVAAARAAFLAAGATGHRRVA